jgi:adenylylsulfate kinase
MQQARPPLGTIWITGLPASGKTTLSGELARALRRRGYDCVLLDGEAVRQRTGNRYGHSLEDRFAVLREIVAIAVEERNNGRVPIVATISHKREMREFARQELGRMLEVFLDCEPSVCAARDHKGHYRRAYAGEYSCFVGVTEPYERWSKADVVIDTDQCDATAANGLLLAASLQFLGGAPSRARSSEHGG